MKYKHKVSVVLNPENEKILSKYEKSSFKSQMDNAEMDIRKTVGVDFYILETKNVDWQTWYISDNPIFKWLTNSYIVRSNLIIYDEEHKGLVKSVLPNTLSILIKKDELEKDKFYLSNNEEFDNLEDAEEFDNLEDALEKSHEIIKSS